MIGHDTLTPKERTYWEECDAFLAEHFDPEIVGRMDRSEVLYPTDFIRMMGRHHYLGACVPAEEGGGGRTVLEDALLNERVGYHGSAALACARTFTSHVGWILAKYGSAQVKERYLGPMLRGEIITAQALTEPGAGSDLGGIQTTARRAGDRYVVNGEKRFLDGAQTAGFISCAVRTAEGDSPRGTLSVLLIDTSSPGYEVLEEHTNWLGFRGLGSAWVRFSDVEVPAANLLGEEGNGWQYLSQELLIERVVATRAQLGQALRALEIAANYAEERETFGEKLRDHQWAAFKVAEASTRLDAAALLNTRAGRLLDEGLWDEAKMEVAMAKWFGVEAAWQTADDALQIMGGIAYTQKYPIERILRDVRASRFTAGSTEMMALIIQRRAFDRLRDPNFRRELVGRTLDVGEDDVRAIPR
ncbi:MAG: acyl-CoA dehydrogenase family protein, partial [Dehalococcoidia bacterium]|nr:acyl-CoA dehydrogenase family protein [Dehalococcoidia bacterium]